jgi:uncharacterized protein with PIN domain
MAVAVFRFYEELNDFLPTQRRKRDSLLEFPAPCPVRHLIEVFGVPHTEVEVILVNGRSVGLDERVKDGDRVSVYPLFEALDISPLLRLRERPLRDPRFVADAHLGRLARYLRLLGFDTQHENDPGDRALANMASRERRILLTRDRGLLMRKEVDHGCYVRENRPLEQLLYVMGRCDLYRLVRPFTRCMKCNSILREVPKAAVAAQLLPATRRHYQQFWQCAGCHQVYWRGSHYARLEKLVHRASEGWRVEKPSSK